jgi:hypothetical protein
MGSKIESLFFVKTAMWGPGNAEFLMLSSRASFMSEFRMYYGEVSRVFGGREEEKKRLHLREAGFARSSGDVAL